MNTAIDLETGQTRDIMYAVSVLSQDAYRLADKVDRTAAGHSTGAVRKWLKRGDINRAGIEAGRVRAGIAKDVQRCGAGVEDWRLESLRRADALVNRLLLCAALPELEDELDSVIDGIKTCWSLELEGGGHGKQA